MPKLKTLLPLFLFLNNFILLPINAQFKNIQIASARGTLGPCEPSIAIDPLNPDIIVAGSVLNRVHYSHDGGLTWESKALESEYGVWGDPCIVVDRNSNFYYFHLSNPENKGWASERLLDRMVCQRSDDGGKTWNSGSFTGLNHPKDQDKEWAAVNHLNNHLYLTWTQFDLYNSTAPGDSSNILFSSSEDHGNSWSEPIRINELAGNCLDDDFAVEGAVPTVGPNGNIYVAWSLGSTIYFDYSKDGGKSWQDNDTKIATQQAGWNIQIPGIGRANGMPVTKCDISNSKHKGRIYVNYADQAKDGEDTDIWLVWSDNEGKDWSEPIIVNDDTTNRHQFFTWMDVDPITGYVYIVFYDRRNFEDTTTEVYLAVSKDGGETFENMKISEKPFTPTNNGVFFGDYNNISAYNGRVRPIWTQLDDRTLSVWTALIDFEVE